MDARPGNVLGQTVMSQPGLALLVLAARLSKRSHKVLDARNLDIDVNLHQSLPYIPLMPLHRYVCLLFATKKKETEAKNPRRLYILTRLVTLIGDRYPQSQLPAPT